nr:hypothetical protein GCM10020241_46480 [Streptoalloteichus tenebrarius]
MGDGVGEHVRGVLCGVHRGHGLRAAGDDAGVEPERAPDGDDERRDATGGPSPARGRERGKGHANTSGVDGVWRVRRVRIIPCRDVTKKPPSRPTLYRSASLR